MLAHNEPVLIDAQVKRNENCYPMVAPGKSNAQMLGLPKRKLLERAAELVTFNHCGAKNTATKKFCPECGTKL